MNLESPATSMELSILNVRKQMALSESVESSLQEAEADLRNALSFAARQERPAVCKDIANILKDLENIRITDTVLDMIDNREPGSSGKFGPFTDN
jgi:hypothetical protein